MFATAVPLRKSLWLPIAQNSRRKPGSLVDVYGYISKYKSDFVSWYAYINPEIYGLDQASDTQYSSPTNSRQKIADNLLKYSMAWNKKYIQEVEKDFFPALFQSASLSTEKFEFLESATVGPPAANNSITVSPISNSQFGLTQTQIRVYDRYGNMLSPASDLPICLGGNETKNSSCFGEQTFPNGDKYIGDFKDGKLHGQGTYLHVADSEWTKEKVHAEFPGIAFIFYQAKKGDRYVGEFKGGDRNGKGIYYGSDGTIKDSGIWEGRRRVTTFMTSSASHFSFERHMQLAADARAREQSSTATRERERLEADSKERERLLVSASQSSLPQCPATGFRHNCIGTVTWASQALAAHGPKYVGEFKDDKFHGQGTYTWADGNKYVGEFKDDKQDGHGTYTFASGEKYVGEFKEGKRNGQGTWAFADGRKYVGEFKDGNFNGQGIDYRADGTIVNSGRWADGKLAQSFALDRSRFPFNAPTQAASVQPTSADSSRLVAEAQAARLRQQELEQRLATQAAEAEVAKRRQQELEVQLAAAQSTAQQIPSTGATSIRTAHALVIGNAAYPGSGRLDNPVNDANAISLKLRSMGFTVTTVTDANRQRLVQAMSQFRRSAASADLSLLFYSGHGVQIFGTNYILPTDVDQTDTAQATIQGVRLNEVIENFMPGKTKLVFLDACRDNPLQRTGDRSVTKGLAPISVSEGTLISYATKDGQVAADGVGSKNSPFTQALLEHLADPLDIGVVLRKVREKVMKATGGKQQPWDYGSLTGGELVLSRIKGGRP